MSMLSRLPNPAEMRRGPKRFLVYLLADIIGDITKRGVRALLPLRLLACIALGIALGLLASKQIVEDAERLIALYSATLTFSAILFAVSWSGFGRIFEVLREPGFGTWLTENDVSGQYDFYIDYIQMTQMLAALASVTGLALALLDVPEWATRSAIGVVFGTIAYATLWAAACVTIMQELLDYMAKWRSKFGGADDERTQDL